MASFLCLYVLYVRSAFVSPYSTSQPSFGKLHANNYSFFHFLNLSPNSIMAEADVFLGVSTTSASEMCGVLRRIITREVFLFCLVDRNKWTPKAMRAKLINATARGVSMVIPRRSRVFDGKWLQRLRWTTPR